MRSRLVYGCQAWEPNEADLRKMEAVWNGFLRKMVRGGFARKNAPTRAMRKKKENKGKKPEDLVDGELDWGYKISTEYIPLTDGRFLFDFYGYTRGNLCK